MNYTHLGLVVSFFTLSIIVFSQPSVTQKDLDGKLGLNTITSSLPFMSITPDSRAGAMGDAGTALSGSSTSLYWNTSMLIFAKEEAEVSISYTPWLRNLTNDMHLSYLSGYKKLGRHAMGGALRYFRLGEITYRDASNNFIREDKPSEFEILAAYAFKLSDNMSVGINGKFAHSNLTGGMVVEGVDTKAAIAGAADVSFTYFNENTKIGETRGDYTFAFTLNNLGNKVSYSSLQNPDFIPMNLKLANSFNMKLDNYNALTVALEFQKMLVPTPAIYDKDANGNIILISGHSSDVGIIKGLMQSFYDAPGTPLRDSKGNYIKNSDGSYQVKKGSKFREELSEINIAFGLEYWYNNMLAIRGGYFREPKNKGDRQFFTAGAGLKYNRLGIDISYLIASGGRRSPLANTIRFTLRLNFGKDSVHSSAQPD